MKENGITLSPAPSRGMSSSLVGTVIVTSFTIERDQWRRHTVLVGISCPHGVNRPLTSPGTVSAA